MQRLLLFFAAACLGFISFAGPAQATLYNCVRPDGSVVCTVETDQEPSGACNHDCTDCNMVCTAQERIVREDGKTIEVPSGPVFGRRNVPPAPGTVETKEYCNRQYARCQAACRDNPADKSAFNLEACLSSCSGTMSGCGAKPSDY
ncbi:MAG: hypothetical protein HQK81_09445 [Desulfovibrionaceae bacterium]|nr:hypothetical protein [Desulfovibrionaceae bacterium]MBF0514264.1 hypothetical protein [Desulfovibrionaceae bacterium]